MVYLNEAVLEHCIIHRVGNAAKEEGVFISEQELPTNASLSEVLIPFLSRGFKPAEEVHQFTHTTDLNLNEVYHHTKQFFHGDLNFTDYSQHMAHLLYNSSDHPMIKPSELIVNHLQEVILDGEICEAVVLVKCENKRNFIEFVEDQRSLLIDLRKGIHLNKIDKGVVILNTEENSGYRALAIDAVNDESKFWQDRFLQLQPDDPSFAYTQNTLHLVQQFAQEVVAQDEDTTARFEMVHNSVAYMQQNETFEVDEFVEQVLPTPAYQEEFKQRHQQMVEESGFEPTELPISQNQVKKAKKQFKDLIHLDNGIQIQLKFNDEETKQYLERGFDPVKGMNYYKVYYHEEQ